LDKQLSPYKSFGIPTKPRRSVQRLNDTEKRILEFLVEKFKDIPDGYYTYSNDAQLLKATGKRQRQQSNALRKLAGWRLLESSKGGMPVLYWIDPENVRLVKRVLANEGYVSAILVLNWARHQMGWFTTRDVAKLLNISKRHAQKIVKILVAHQLIKRTHLSGRGYKGRVVYSEAKGQLPLDHFTRSHDVLSNLKYKLYTTQNEFT